MGLHDEAKLDQKFVGFAKLMNIHLNHFPKHEKYGLAQEIRRAAYDVYALIVECQKRYQKKTTLTNLDIRHEQLRMLVRLAYNYRVALRRGAIDSAASILGHARHTHSLQHMLRFAKEHHHASYLQLPEIYYHRNHSRTAPAGRR